MPMRKDTGEIEKQVVFSKTGKRIVHGTKTAYQYHKCRCFLCQAQHRKYAREANRRKRGHVPFVESEQYMPYLQKHIERGVIPYRIAQFSGIDANIISAMLNKRRPVKYSTFELLLMLPDELPVGRSKPSAKIEKTARTKPSPEARDRYATEAKRKGRFRRIIGWMYDNGFTDATLADKLGITERQWDLFCLGSYNDRRIGMRLCRLHHLLRLGE
jgi:hypothetical protein